MSHWAEIDENGIVIRVTVGNNDDPNKDEGYKWLIDNLGGTWIKTSYNNRFRGVFAGVGYNYDKDNDVFLPPGINYENLVDILIKNSDGSFSYKPVINVERSMQND
jgi:hypothetical protein